MVHKRCVLFFTAVLATTPGVAPCRAATPAAIDASLQKAIAALYAQQRDGNWEIVSAPRVPPIHDSVEGGQWGGLTGIATYALLAAEQSPRDPRILKAIDFLENAKMRGVYAISVRSQVWPFLPPSHEVREAARRDFDLLKDGVKTRGPGRGLWFYYVDTPNDDMADNSASQFALLGIWACGEAGVEIPTGLWQREDEIWRRHQTADGGWPYVNSGSGEWGQQYLSMTCAGVASLFITQEKLDSATTRCKAQPADSVIDSGMTYITRHFPANFSAAPPYSWVSGEGPRPMYLLFGLSRLGLASGLRYFGDKNWFDAGCDYLLKAQHPNGSWGSNASDTAFGILFLARAGAAVAFNKLQYSDPAAPTLQEWNVRPRDLANLTSWMSKQTEHRINWQIVDAKTDPSDWLDAPILYIGGADELKLPHEQVDALKKFVELGGLIVANPDCGNEKFAGSFRKLARQLFPMYAFRDLPANHPIFTQEQYPRTRAHTKFRVQGLSNGVRELLILCPDVDLGRTFQAQNSTSKPEQYEFAADLYQYMVGLERRRRGDTCVVNPDPSIKVTRTVRMARLKYAGNWDPEPGGWQRLANVLLNHDKIEVHTQWVELGVDKLVGFPIAHLTGTASVKLEPAQKTALAEYVKSGGTLLIDAAGGRSDFAAAIEPQLHEIFGESPSVLPADAAIYKSGDVPLADFAYRRFAKSILGGIKSPRLRAISVGGRQAVLFSAEDLSEGLVGQPVDGIVGYTPDTATEIVRHIVLLAPK